MRIAITLFLLFLLAFATGDVGAQALQVDRIEVVEYGIYTVSLVHAERDAKGILQSSLSNIQHVETTRMVPAKIGVRFGFRFVVVGTPKDAKVTLRKITHFPPGGLQPPGSKEALSRSETTMTRTIGGEARYTDYGFDDPWELVPGPWTIELWYGDRKLASQSFTVFKP